MAVTRDGRAAFPARPRRVGNFQVPQVENFGFPLTARAPLRSPRHDVTQHAGYAQASSPWHRTDPTRAAAEPPRKSIISILRPGTRPVHRRRVPVS